MYGINFWRLSHKAILTRSSIPTDLSALNGAKDYSLLRAEIRMSASLAIGSAIGR